MHHWNWPLTDSTRDYFRYMTDCMPPIKVKPKVHRRFFEREARKVIAAMQGLQRPKLMGKLLLTEDFYQVFRSCIGDPANVEELKLKTSKIIKTHVEIHYGCHGYEDLDEGDKDDLMDFSEDFSPGPYPCDNDTEVTDEPEIHREPSGGMSLDRYDHSWDLWAYPWAAPDALPDFPPLGFERALAREQWLIFHRIGDTNNPIAAHEFPAIRLNAKMSPMKRSHQTYTGLPAAIFIHAGAGFHSIQNEKYHLSVCSDAASKAMKILKAGGSAVDAVEAAIKHLEDHEITNAGYGSNLTIDGTVECDATIVDHLGRSGACGAVPNTKNPISLAKTILETSSKTLTLRRVPPNFLIGEGAKRFGIEHGVIMVPNEQLVSRNARDRYNKWRADLDKVTPSNESGNLSPLSASGYNTDSADERRKGRDGGSEKLKLDINIKARKGLQRDHVSALMNGLWNEGQPDSPTSETRSPLAGYSNTSVLRPSRTVSPATPTAPAKRAKISTPVATNKSGTSPSAADDLATLDGAQFAHTSDLLSLDSSYFTSNKTESKTADDTGMEFTTANLGGTPVPRLDATELTAEPTVDDKDMIVDTIGAIAIDLNGNIAAGSSSGGIGIKHMGRTGPAALVGVGTAVIPYDAADDEFKTVATVTSGTGEHMATTMAAQKCAERLYQGTRRGEGGLDQKEDDVSAILQSFVQSDFMDHPGVKNQASVRAIGVMAVEATASGIFVHWAHNTESFALASMSSEDKQPVCVMSRLPEGTASVTIGGRKVHVEVEASGDAGW